MVSNHRFSGSRNLLLVLDIMCKQEKTLMGTLLVSAIMPKLLKVSKMVNIPSREVKVVSNYRFTGSRNLFLALDIICDEVKTLIGVLWVSRHCTESLQLNL